MYAWKIKMVKEEGITYPDEQFRSPEIVANLIAKYIDNPDREIFILCSLNTRNYINGINTVSVGSLDTSIVHPREVFKFAILRNAASLIFVHNHPSGDTTPSSDDIELTKRLKQAGDILGISILDHIIIGPSGNYMSMKSRGLI